MSKRTLIAEIGHNWEEFTDIKRLIRFVKIAGWDVAKFQLYDVDKIKKPSDENYDRLAKKQLSSDMMWQCKAWCDEYGVEFACSVFDQERLYWYMKTKPKKIKLSQRSYQDIQLCNLAYDMSTRYDIELIASCPNDYIPLMWKTYKKRPTILWCMSRREIIHNGVQRWPEEFGKEYDGFSDHTIGLFYSKLALNTGATVLEKHITFNHNAPGWDQPCSATLLQMRNIANTARWLEEQQKIR